LSGEWSQDRLLLCPAPVWHDLDVELRCGVEVTAIETSSRTIVANGSRFAWHKLALATGARPRPVPPAFDGRERVFELRGIADVERLRRSFEPGRRLLVVGGGFIGLETAAVAAEHGLQVTVVERASRILERTVGPEVSAYFRDLHTRKGVRILEGIAIAEVMGEEAIEAVRLATGETIAADCALIGVGVVPNVELALAAGLRIDDGIVVDEFGRTSRSGIWAAGDCTSFPLADELIRLESVQNAVDQAEVVAAGILGQGKPYCPVPWFWSDQYEAKLQIAGLASRANRTVSTRSTNGEAHWRFRDDVLVAVEAINDGRSFMLGRKLLASGTSVDAEALARGNLDPRSLLP
jgi:3-phenylpropionate/trans-cinnamate dioxygenase ferredoxin reductase subunit